MKDVLFRGKRQDNGEWIEGCLLGVYERVCRAVYQPREYAIQSAEEWIAPPFVVAETVGQFTGLYDKNGTRIFEGDIMVACKGATRPFEIRWDGLGWKMFEADGERIRDPFESWEIWYMQKSEVIGNKWDNPELLEVEK